MNLPKTAEEFIRLVESFDLLMEQYYVEHEFEEQAKIDAKLNEAKQRLLACASTFEGPVRELTDKQRGVWGRCPLCRAEDGQRCFEAHTMNRAEEGIAHLGRVLAAPRKVRMVPVEE